MNRLSLKRAQSMLKNKEISAVELVQETVNKAKANHHNAFITVCEYEALAQAKISQEKIDQGEMRPLEGIPVAIKDIFCTKGIKTTCASKMLSDFIPPYESEITNNLWNNGAIMVGKTNMDEFAMGSANINSYYGKCINPWQDKTAPEKKLVPGGSSGGSAVSVLEGSSFFALGTDTGGSIRQPAAFCGLVGIKPSYGTCSRYGVISYASSLDQAGVFSNSVEDAATALDIMASFDQRDSTSIPTHLRPFKSFAESLNQPLKGVTVGIPKQYDVKGILPSIRNNWKETADKLQKEGAIIKEIDLPHSPLAIGIYYIVSTAEASSNLARYDGIRYGHTSVDNIADLEELYIKNRTEGFGDEVKRRIMLGTFVLSSDHYEKYYNQALRVRRLIKKDFDDAFEKVDVILCPTTPNVAFGTEDKISDPLLMYLNDIFTVPINLAGLPGVSVPTGYDAESGLPIGMQVISKALNDPLMISVAGHVERIVNFKIPENKF